MTLPVTPFQTGDTVGVSEHLNAEFSEAGQQITDLAAAVAEGNDALHGPGKEAGGCGLSVGTGLSCVLGAGHFWVGGVRYEIAEAQVIALTPNETSYLYQDSTGSVTAYVSQQSPRPAGTWFLGTATTDGTTCTAVDDSEADTVSGVADLGDRLTAAEEAIDDAEAALADHEARIGDLETLGGGGGGGPVYADGIPRSSTNPQTVGQEFAALEADIAALQAAGTGGGSVVSVPAPVWDVDADNQALELQAQTTAGALEAATQQFNTIQIKWGVYGDGSGETPDFVDRDVSTWLPSE